MVSDPSYDVGTWCQGVLDNVLPGTWKAGAIISDEKTMGKRVGTLFATHSDLSEKDLWATDIKQTPLIL
jgi:hypothetical protein